MTGDQLKEMLAVTVTALTINALVTALQLPVDSEFQVF